ncbi:MAG: hypothetical protein AAFO69_10410, partial [Bacteroidota bacterium]
MQKRKMYRIVDIYTQFCGSFLRIAGILTYFLSVQLVILLNDSQQVVAQNVSSKVSTLKSAHHPICPFGLMPNDKGECIDEVEVLFYSLFDFETNRSNLSFVQSAQLSIAFSQIYAVPIH